jgi:hypothetical protein
MDRHKLLTITSLLSLLLLSLHITHDMVLGLDVAGPSSMVGIAILIIFAIGPLLLREHLVGRILILLGALGAMGMPVLHTQGRSFPDVVRGEGGFFFFWTLMMLGITGTLALIMIVLEFWKGAGSKKASAALS